MSDGQEVNGHLAAIKENVAEIKGNVEKFTDMMTDPDRGFGPRVVRLEESVGDMKKEGVWDAINAEQGRRARRKIWYSVATTFIVASIFAVIKLLTFLAQLSASVGV